MSNKWLLSLSLLLLAGCNNNSSTKQEIQQDTIPNFIDSPIKYNNEQVVKQYYLAQQRGSR